MKNTIKYLVLFLTVVSLSSACLGQSQISEPADQEDTNSELVVLWTTAEKEVLMKMLGIYVLNAKKQTWFENITVIVWGPSAKLLAEDKEVQDWITKFKEAGVTLEACMWCTNQYGITEDLKAMGIDVKGMGTQLTKYLKDSGKEVIVF